MLEMQDSQESVMLASRQRDPYCPQQLGGHMEVQPELGTSGEVIRAGGTAVKLPEKGLCFHWPMTQWAHLSLEQEVNTASYLELPKPIPGGSAVKKPPTMQEM